MAMTRKTNLDSEANAQGLHAHTLPSGGGSDTPPARASDDIKRKDNAAAQLFNIKGVEIFAAGIWNGDKYTTQDLDSMVKAFQDNKNKIRPFLKLGHDNDQKILQRDGLPAAGWISELKRVGDKLIANFSDIPKKVFQLIENKAYRKVSSEIYWNIEVNGQRYKRMLSAVALLGSDLPAVTNLDSILGLFIGDEYESIKSYASNQESAKLKEYNYSERENDMSELLKRDLEDSQKEVKSLNESVKKFKQESAGVAKQLAELKAYKAEQDKKNAEMEIKLKKEQDENAWADLEKFGLPVSAKEYVVEYLSDKKDYSVKEKSLSKPELLKEILKLYGVATGVNLEQNSLDAKEVKPDQSELVKNAENYAKENDVTFGQALKAVQPAVTI